MNSNVIGDRRPIASRNQPVWQFTARKLAALGVSPNVISVLGMFAAALAAAALVLTAHVAGHVRLLYLAAAAFIQLRLLANMLDGMVAIAAEKASPLGELYNEIPDRVSDTLILVAAGYALHSEPTLGWAAATMALFVTYIRAFGKSVSVPGLFHGPMSKSHRMFTLTVACVYLGLAPLSWQPTLTVAGRPMGIMALALAVILVGTLVTAVRRLAPIVRSLKERSP